MHTLVLLKSLVVSAMVHLPLRALKVFEAVARRGSFKDAAEELSVSQSAVSHQIKHLEEWLDRPLFDRTGHHPLLLAHGEMLARALQRSLQEIGSACELARGNASPGALVIASIPSVAICWLIPRLSDFRARHPDIATRMVYALHGQDIDFKQVDLAFVYTNSPPALPGLQARFFQPGTSVPVCSPALRDTLDLSAMPEAILKAGLLHDANANVDGGWIDWLGQAGLDPVPPVTGPVFEDVNLLRAAALAGQGVALCPLAMIGTDLVAKRLIQLSNIAVNRNFNYYLITRATNNPETATAMEHFVAWVFDMLDADAALAYTPTKTSPSGRTMIDAPTEITHLEKSETSKAL